MWIQTWSVSMSQCGYGHGMSPCLHVNTDTVSPHFHVDMDIEFLHISMWIQTQSISMSPCGYRHRGSPCLHVDMDM